MESFTTLEGVVLPIDRANIDTDAIIPKQFLKSVKRTGFGPNLFDEWRYLDKGEPGNDNESRPKNPDFPLNYPQYSGASILLARENFGCGSSREHAPWALLDYGIRCIIAPSFADIFFNNCFKNAILPVVFNDKIVDYLFEKAINEHGFQLIVNLRDQTVETKDDKCWEFEVEKFRKYCLINGLDDIGLTLEKSERIKEYESRRSTEMPWLFS